MTLKIGVLQILKGQMELEEVFIKKLFDYKFLSGKCLSTVNWLEQFVTTVDTLTCIYISDNGYKFVRVNQIDFR